MSQQSLVLARGRASDIEMLDIDLTPLGRAVSDLPTSPRIGRMLTLGLALRAIDPALTIAALLSVPKAFGRGDYRGEEAEEKPVCSDVVARLAAFEEN